LDSSESVLPDSDERETAVKREENAFDRLARGCSVQDFALRGHSWESRILQENPTDHQAKERKSKSRKLVTTVPLVVGVIDAEQHDILAPAIAERKI
jgi:hypothetical protein